jgi:hypothetical protein
MNNWAKTNGMNRVLDDSVIKDLDPNGLNLLAYRMEHNHKQGIKVEPHWRMMLLLKLTDQIDPVNGFLDVSFNLYDKCINIINLNAFANK